MTPHTSLTCTGKLFVLNWFHFWIHINWGKTKGDIKNHHGSSLNMQMIMTQLSDSAIPLIGGMWTTFLAATKQLYEWYFLSVCLSVCLSVTPFWLCSHHRMITKFSGVITNDRSDVHAKGHGQRSKVKVTEVTTQRSRFRTVTSVWIHIWWWNHAYGLMILRRGALLFFKVIHQISRSHGSKKHLIWPRLGLPGL